LCFVKVVLKFNIFTIVIIIDRKYIKGIFYQELQNNMIDTQYFSK